MAEAVELGGVVAGYRSRSAVRRVLDGVDLVVEEGEMVALLGSNGSGKTTLLRVLAGTHPVDRGHVALFGRPIDHWTRTEVARTVAVLPQSGSLPPGFRVAEIVAMGRIPHAASWFGSAPGDERAVADALDDADAAGLAHRRVDELSGGERQRVLVAMALAQGPRLLLLDEPTAHLDLARQVALVETLARLRRVRQLTVVAVLHDLNLAAAFADRSVILHDGRLRAAGDGQRGIDAALVASTFGVAIQEATTADGRRVLAALPDATRARVTNDE